MRKSSFIFVVFLMFVSGCTEEKDQICNLEFDKVPHHMVAISRDGQSGEPGIVCEERLIVRVLSAADYPIENVHVFFSIDPPHHLSGLGSVTSQVDVLHSRTNVGQIFGEYLHEITLQGSTAYIPMGTFGNGVAVVDFQDPTDPVVETYVSTLASRDLSADGNLLCSVSGNDFHTLNLTNPLYPTLLGTLELNSSAGAAATAVAVSGGVAFVTGGGPALGSFGALQSIDINDPGAPVYGTRSEASGGADILIDGDYAYVAAYDYGLMIFDISDPLVSLPVVGTTGSGGSATKLILDGDRVFVMNTAYSSASIAVINVTAPDMPSLETVVTIPARWYYQSYGSMKYSDMALDEDWLLVGGNLGVVVVDISIPSAPEFLGLVEPESYIGGIEILDGQVLVAHSTGLSVLDVVPIDGARE